MGKIISLIFIIEIVFSPLLFCELDNPDTILISHFLKLLKSSSFYLQNSTTEIPSLSLPDIRSASSLNEFVERLREKGYPVGIWYIASKEIKNSSFPFLTYLKNKGWVIVKSLREDKLIIESKNGEKEISRNIFEEEWSGFLISLYMCGVWLKTLLPLDKKNEKSDFYIIYSYHDEDFPLIKKYLEEILMFADEVKQTLLYVDELGLIPLDTINNYMKIYKLSEKEAFERIKKELNREVKNLARGIPIYDPLDTYNKIYHFLAERRIESTMEDLDYMNWRKIVILDHVGLLKNSFLAFRFGDLDLYLNFLTEYNNKYWKYNINERDSNFVHQLIELKKNNPGKLIFTIRGLSHLGLEEKLAEKGYKVKFIVVGDGFVLNNIAFRHLVFTSYNINAAVDVGWAYTFAYVQETIRDYLAEREQLRLREATIRANNLVANLSVSDIKDLAEKLAEEKGQNVADFIYRFAKSRMEDQ